MLLSNEKVIRREEERQLCGEYHSKWESEAHISTKQLMSWHLCESLRSMLNILSQNDKAFYQVVSKTDSVIFKTFQMACISASPNY